LRFFEGFRLLICTGERGVVTGWGCGSATTGERALAETLFEGRVLPQPDLPSAGRTMGACYLADMGFSGQACQERWREQDGAQVVSPPQTRSKAEWPEEWTRQLARVRQVIESVFRRLLHDFRLEHERPHTLDGFLTRLAAKIGLHNVCIAFNRQHGHPDLALAGLVEW
jgi:Transposase DDE domain